MKMNTENELFGELHEQEEYGLFGKEQLRQHEAKQEALRLSAVSYQLPHYFDAPDEDKSSRFCKCGKYLTDDVHLRQL
jgi:hypothetical protein